MALKAGYVGVKRWLYEKLQATAAKNVKDITDLKEGQSLLGAVNNLDLTAVTTTSNNVTVTVNADKSVSVVTTSAGASSTTFIPLESYKARTGQKIYVKGCPAGGGMTNYCLQIRAQDQSSVGIEDGSGKWFEFDSDDNALYALGIRINTGAKITTPIKFYPVLTLTDLNYPFAPYAMTNQQLTKSIIKTTGTFDQVTANKSGYMVELSFTGTTITNEDGKTLGTLDAAYRPGANINFYTKVYNGSSYVDAQVKVTASTGAVELLTLSGSAVTGAQVNFLLARPVFMSGSASGLSRGGSDTREASPEVIADDPEPVTKTTRKSTKKEDN